MTLTMPPITTGERLTAAHEALNKSSDLLATLQTALGSIRTELEHAPEEDEHATASEWAQALDRSIIDAVGKLDDLWKVADKAAGDVITAQDELMYVVDPDDDIAGIQDELNSLAAYVIDVDRGIRPFSEALDQARSA